MSDELRAAISVLQTGDDAQAQQAFGEIAHMVRREPAECAAVLSRAILDEDAAGGLRTARLLTLLGMTRVPAADCVPLCVALLHNETNTSSPLPVDATLGAAAIVARVNPRSLLPDLGSKHDAELAQALPLLLSISSGFLGQLPDNSVTDMGRWFWFDCATCDLMTVTDLVAWQAQESGADHPLVSLLVDLVERLPASADQKNYAVERLYEAGVSPELIEQLQTAWRAIRVAPALVQLEFSETGDPDPPPPDARADQWLAMFAEGDETSVELARVAIDQMFEDKPSKALPWWVALTVDALPPWRRRDDIDWALVQIATALRRHGADTVAVPPLVMQRWLDTPQLLNSRGTKIALDLLSRRNPDVIVQRYLHRAVAASSESHSEILMGGLWSALAAHKPAVLLAIASRWLAADFGQSSFLELLLDQLIKRARTDDALIDTLGQSLGSMPDMSEHAIDVARNALQVMREQSQENSNA